MAERLGGGFTDRGIGFVEAGLEERSDIGVQVGGLGSEGGELEAAKFGRAIWVEDLVSVPIEQGRGVVQMGLGWVGGGEQLCQGGQGVGCGGGGECSGDFVRAIQSEG